MAVPHLFKNLISSVSIQNKRTRASLQTKKLIEMCRALLSERGEVSGSVLAREALAAWQKLPDAGLREFFDLLESEFGPDAPQLDQACAAYREQPSPENLLQLQRCAEAPRQELFRRLNMAPGGTASLIEMRRQLLSKLKLHAQWQSIDADFSHLFSSWFNRGFLTLALIDWRTPAIILEKLIEYEAVHEIAGWKDLHRRLEVDRRCFAFFHPVLPDEPLIFIEVALTRGMSAAIQPLLAQDAPVTDPQTADTAIFYSITSCQEGLRGISLGNLLIKQVAQRLGQEFPRIKTFATLSPVTGFLSWLKNAGLQLLESKDGAAVAEQLRLIEYTRWIKHAGAVERLRKVLMPLCAYYLSEVKQNAEPLDPVARFHLSNGARLERLNWMADTSKRGVQRSAGLMVNYLYRLEDVEENHEMYVKEHRVPISKELTNLARACVLNEIIATSKLPDDQK